MLLSDLLQSYWVCLRDPLAVLLSASQGPFYDLAYWREKGGTWKEEGKEEERLEK